LLYVGITRAEKKLYLTHAEERRRNGELLPSRQSSFLDAIPDAMVEKRNTIKVRSSGRSVMRAGGEFGSYGRNYGRASSAGSSQDAEAFFTNRPSPSARRPGTPVGNYGVSVSVEDESQDAPLFVVGARVKHRKFGSGSIAELSGSGRDAKVKVDFDDETIGRKTLVIAQANLERGDD
jgi:DNA helicase II / ATP-dependent DNA helicase PcrA